MSAVSLPQELQTPKLKSLDGDLKTLAEELIAKKFDIKEEVVEQKAPDPFRGDVEYTKRPCGNYVPANVQCNCNRCESLNDSGPGFWGGISPDKARAWDDFSRRRAYQTVYLQRGINPEVAIQQLIYKFDEMDIPPRERVIYMHPRDIDEILRSNAYIEQDIASRCLRIWGHKIVPDVTARRGEITMEARY